MVAARRLPWTDGIVVLLLTAPALLAAKLWPLPAERVVTLAGLNDGHPTSVLEPDIVFVQQPGPRQTAARVRDGQRVPLPFPAPPQARPVSVGAGGTLAVGYDNQAGCLRAHRWLPGEGRFTEAGSVRCDDPGWHLDRDRPLVSYRRGGRWHLWDVAADAHRPLPFLPSDPAPAMVIPSPDGTALLALLGGGEGGSRLEVWDAAAGRRARVLPIAKDHSVAPVFARDGRTLVVHELFGWSPDSQPPPTFPFHLLPTDPDRPVRRRDDLHDLRETADGFVGLRHRDGGRWEVVALDPETFDPAADRVLLSGRGDAPRPPHLQGAPGDPWACVCWRQAGPADTVARWLKQWKIELKLLSADRCQWVTRAGATSGVLHGHDMVTEWPGSGLAAGYTFDPRAPLAPLTLTLYRRAPPDPFLGRLPLALSPAALYLTVRWRRRRRRPRPVAVSDPEAP